MQLAYLTSKCSMNYSRDDVWICIHNWRRFLLFYFYGFCLEEIWKIFQTQVTLFHHISTHLENRQKYSTALCILRTLFIFENDLKHYLSYLNNSFSMFKLFDRQSSIGFLPLACRYNFTDLEFKFVSLFLFRLWKSMLLWMEKPKWRKFPFLQEFNITRKYSLCSKSDSVAVRSKIPIVISWQFTRFLDSFQLLCKKLYW